MCGFGVLKRTWDETKADEKEGGEGEKKKTTTTRPSRIGPDLVMGRVLKTTTIIYKNKPSFENTDYHT